MSKVNFATIWDGIEYRQTSQEEADQLEREDKCQIVSKHIFSATELKFREQFTGYKTRELRAEVPVLPKVEKPYLPKDLDPIASVEDWKNYKEAAAGFLDKPINKVTKAQVLNYMEQELGLKTT